MKFQLSVAMLAAPALLVAGLAACSPTAPATDAASAPAADSTAAPATSAPSMPAEMAEGPAAGKWRMTMTSMGQTMPAQEICYEKQMTLEESQKMQQQAGVACSEQSYRREGDAYVGHSVCSMDMAGKTIETTTDMRITGDFKTKYAMDMTSKMDPAPMPDMAEQKMTIAMERLGDC